MAEKLSNILNINGKDYEVTSTKSDIAVSAVTAEELNTGGVIKNATHIQANQDAIASIKNGNTVVPKAKVAEEAEEAAIADKAKQVENSLTITESHTNGATTDVKFNGSASKNVSIVPASGGKFTGRVTVPNVESNISLKDLSETVLNYSDIKSKMTADFTTELTTQLTNTSLVYKWKNSVLSPALANTNLAGISLIEGLEEDVNKFANKNYNNCLSNATNDPSNPDKIWLASYLYLCTDSKNIYYGTSDLSYAVHIAKNATTASQLSTGTVTKNATHIQANEEAIADIKDGTITVKKAESATRAAIAINSTNITDGTNKLTYSTLKDLDTKMNSIYASAGTVKKATRAFQDANGRLIHDNYYQSPYNTGNINKIHIGTNRPAPANYGDIWIKI